MILKQLSLFLQNEPGSLTTPCKVLAAAGINIITFSLADSQQFGILRLIVTDWEKAKSVLEQSGCLVKVTEVAAIEVDDKPGGLVRVLEALEGTSVNVEYVYAFTFKKENRGVLVFRFDRPELAIQALQQRQINALGAMDLNKLLG